VFVLNGDTIGKTGIFSLMTENEFNADSILENFTFEFDVDNEGNNNVFVLKSRNGNKHMVQGFSADGDSNKVFKIQIDSDELSIDPKFFFWNEEDENETFFAPQNIDVLNAPRIRIRKEIDRSNVIDLSDVGIISYKKKTNRDGTEKITIIRKKVDEPNIEKEEEIIMGLNLNQPNNFFNNSPKLRQIQIIKEVE
jgi:hypothetical protein